MFTNGMQKWATNIMKAFEEYKFYIGEKMDPEGMVVVQGYREDQITPYFIFFKDGVNEEKY